MPALILIAPTRGEHRAVEAAVKRSGRPVEMRLCGVGPTRSAALCAQLEAGPRPQGLALLGWAGGLVDDLAPGDVVLADRALCSGQRTVTCTPLPVAGLPGLRWGPMLTADRVLATADAKRAAARCGALAVEMEAYPLAAWAAQRGIPFVHGRVILDAVGDAIPDLDGVLDGYGRVQVRNLLAALTRRPALLRDAGRLPRHLARVNRRLTELAAAVVAAWPPSPLA